MKLARRGVSFAAALSSGLLLAASFPPLEWSNAAWVALVPLLLVVRFATVRASLVAGFVGGAVFWLLTLAWLTHVTVAGWIVLALYSALYIAAFCGLAGWCMRRVGTGRPARNAGLLLALPVLWVGLELLRSVLCTGFPWNLLGVCQYRNIAIIQVAECGGVYAVSALVVLVNAGLTLTLLRYVHAFRARRNYFEALRRKAAGNRAGAEPARPSAPMHVRGHLEMLVALGIVLASFVWGLRAQRRRLPHAPNFDVVAVQPNIPREEKWTEDMTRTIHDRLRHWSRLLQGLGPDLIVWPETALPDCVRLSAGSHELVRNLVQDGTPILAGSMDMLECEGREEWYNSAFLFDTNGCIAAKYDKQHLVMFGEYVPLEPLFPFLRALTPVNGSFVPGTESTVFRLGDVAFSALICFEDALPWLARRFVRAGARLLVNQTNDAWFDVSAASRQHMTHCVFRCVENRVPAIRAANTGVTCAIDRTGRIRRVLTDESGNVRVGGAILLRVAVPGPEYELTFYARYGDVFAGACLVAVAGLCGWILVLTRRRTVR